MKLIDRIKFRKILQKHQGRARFIESAKHALDGIKYRNNYKKNFKIEIIFAIIVMILSFLLKVTIIELGILILIISMVLALEMVNTAIERSVDLVTKDYNELAKIAKDVSAGAVLVMSMFSVIIGIIIFLPKILEILGGK